MDCPRNPIRNSVKIFIGADHAGTEMKDYIIPRLTKAGFPIEDVGCLRSTIADDYPDIAVKVARHVSKHPNSKGILICGTGTGMVIAANKVKGIRAALCYDRYSAQMARADNDANILTLRGRNVSKNLTWGITKVWLSTPFSGQERHLRRIKKISKLER